MRINWFKDENHLVYINGATQLAELERTLHFPGLEEAEYLFLHGRDAGVLRHLLAGCAGSQVNKTTAAAGCSS